MSHSHEFKIFRIHILLQSMHDHTIRADSNDELSIRCFRITVHGHGALGLGWKFVFAHAKHDITRACGAISSPIEQATVLHQLYPRIACLDMCCEIMHHDRRNAVRSCNRHLVSTEILRNPPPVVASSSDVDITIHDSKWFRKAGSGGIERPLTSGGRGVIARGTSVCSQRRAPALRSSIDDPKNTPLLLLITRRYT